MEGYFDRSTERYKVLKYLNDVAGTHHADVTCFAKMLKKNMEKGVWLVDTINKVERNPKLCLGFESNLARLQLSDLSRYIGHCPICKKQSKIIKKEQICKRDRELICDGFDEEFICIDCLGKRITQTYINEGLNKSTSNIGEKKMAEEVKNEKFVKIEGLVTDTVGNLAIIKDGVAYSITEDGSLVAVAAGATPDKAYALIKVSVSGVKKGAVVIDPKHNKPVFVEAVNGSRMTFRDIIGQSSYDRDFVPDVITGEATVLQVISVIKLVRGNNEILGLINRYGSTKVFNTLVNQYLTYGDVNASRIEAEINPAMIQLNLTTSMNNMTAAIGELLARMK